MKNKIVVIAVIVAIVAIVLSGCRSVRYVEVPVEHTNVITQRDTLLKVDSILTRDSVWMVLKGDTVWKEKYKYVDRLKYVYKTQHDTIYERVDSTIVKVEYVEKPMSFFKKVKLGLWGAILALVVFFVAGCWNRGDR